jgi:hypothetical protein
MIPTLVLITWGRYAILPALLRASAEVAHQMAGLFRWDELTSLMRSILTVV